jgi:hypothetical protein
MSGNMAVSPGIVFTGGAIWKVAILKTMYAYNDPNKTPTQKITKNTMAITALAPGLTVRHDAITSAKCTEAQARMHCVESQGMAAPDDSEVFRSRVLLDSLRDNVNREAIVQLRSIYVSQARSKGITKAASDDLVNSIDDLHERWRSKKFDIELAKKVFEITVLLEDERPHWLSEIANAIVVTLGLNIVGVNTAKKGSRTFVEEIISKISKPLCRLFTRPNRNVSHAVGLCLHKKHSVSHPMGPHNAAQGNNFFQFQHVVGWDELCRLDPVARAIYQEYKDGINQNDTVDQAIARHTHWKQVPPADQNIGHGVVYAGSDQESLQRSIDTNLTHSISSRESAARSATRPLISTPLLPRASNAGGADVPVQVVTTDKESVTRQPLAGLQGGGRLHYSTPGQHLVCGGRPPLAERPRGRFPPYNAPGQAQVSFAAARNCHDIVPHYGLVPATEPAQDRPADGISFMTEGSNFEVT